MLCYSSPYWPGQWQTAEWVEKEPSTHLKEEVPPRIEQTQSFPGNKAWLSKGRWSDYRLHASWESKKGKLTSGAPCWHSAQGFLRHLPSKHLLEGREIYSGVWSKSWMPATQLKKKGDFYSNTVSPHTCEPSSCDLSKMQTCIPTANHKVSSCVWRTSSCAHTPYRLLCLYVLYCSV